MFKLAPNPNIPVQAAVVPPRRSSDFTAPAPAGPLPLRRSSDVRQVPLRRYSDYAGPSAGAGRGASGGDWMFIWRRKGIILSGLTLSLLLGLSAEFVLKPRYRAAAQILIGAGDLRVIEKSVLPQSQSSEAVLIQVESQTRVMTSDKVLRRVVENEKLESDPEFGGRQRSLFRQTIGAITGVAGTESERPALSNAELSALSQLQRAVVARRTERTSVVELIAETSNPQKSARIANAVVQAYIDETSASHSDVTRRATDSLMSRLSELKERVRSAEEQVERYKAENNIVGANGRLVNEQQLTELNNQMTSARARTAEVKARLEQMQQLIASGADVGATTEAVQSNTIGRLRELYAAAARQEANLVAQLGPQHPWLVEARAQVRDAQRLITEEINRIAAAYNSDYVRAKSYEDSLAKSLDALKQGQMQTSLAFVKMRELEREAEASRVVYEQFLNRSRETREQERLDIMNVRVLSDAQPSQDRSWPPRTLYLVIAAMMLGLPVSTMLAYVVDRFKNRSKSRRLASAPMNRAA